MLEPTEEEDYGSDEGSDAADAGAGATNYSAYKSV